MSHFSTVFITVLTNFALKNSTQEREKYVLSTARSESATRMVDVASPASPVTQTSSLLFQSFNPIVSTRRASCPFMFI